MTCFWFVRIISRLWKLTYICIKNICDFWCSQQRSLTLKFIQADLPHTSNYILYALNMVIRLDDAIIYRCIWVYFKSVNLCESLSQICKLRLIKAL